MCCTFYNIQLSSVHVCTSKSNLAQSVAIHNNMHTYPMIIENPNSPMNSFAEPEVLSEVAGRRGIAK